MKSVDPLLAAWKETLARKGDAPAVLNRRRDVLRTFRDIEEEAAAFESKIEVFDPGTVVAIQIGNRPEWPSILLACCRREVVVLPLEQSISEQERDVALGICRAHGLVAAAVPGAAEAATATIHKIDNVPSPDWNEKPPSLLKLTSGTTAAPRAVRFRSEQLLADCNQICDTMGITDLDLNFGVIPLSHSYGFSNLLTPLIVRGVPLALSGDRLPRAVLGDLAETKATVFPAMPVLYQTFCEVTDLPKLRNLRLCISAGAPLQAAVAKTFCDKLKQPIHSFYGSSECGGICYDRAGINFQDGFVGTPMKDVALEVVDLASESSQVRVRSAAVGDGYFPEPDEEKLGGGLFVPDDLLIGDDSGFRIVGRISDMINVAGKKVNPAEVEAQLLALAGVKEAIVFGRKSALRNEEVVACVVANPNVRESELLNSCRTRLSGWQVPKRIFLVEKIPVNERGKTSRRDLALRFAGS